ncbi:hypothetical protein V6245_09685 [Salinibacterium amurskyense]|uniref:DUF7507 domain-containing protein n=1 Tax=Salinibacterium amurskyense TaxID=205941 RepID=UPI00311D703A
MFYLFQNSVATRRAPERSTALRSRGLPAAMMAAVASLAAVALIATPASAATYVHISDEVSGNNIAGRASASLLRDAWGAAITARGATVPAPLAIAGVENTELSGVIATSVAGTTISVERSMYTLGLAPTFVGVSPSQGIAQCTGSGRTLQSSAPRPDVILGNTDCDDANGFTYGESGGNSQEANTRDGIEFTFGGTGALAFGAWFGDLETRTDGLGVPALLRLYDGDGSLLSEAEIEPAGDQSTCSNSSTGCGNRSTRWIGFVADLNTPVARMVVIVGDEDATGDASNEGTSFVGPSIVDGTAALSVVKTSTPLPAGPSEVGDLIQYQFELTNDGSLPLSSVAIVDAGAQNVSCPSTSLTTTMTCTGEHVVTQLDINAGSFVNTATVSGIAWGEAVTSEPASATTAVNQNVVLTATQTAATSTFSELGETLTFDIGLLNDGNVTLSGLAVAGTVPGISIDCSSVPAQLAPGTEATCTATAIVAAVGSDISNVATVATDQLTAESNVATVRYVAPAAVLSSTTASLANTGSSPVAGISVGGLLLAAGALLLGSARLSAQRR